MRNLVKSAKNIGKYIPVEYITSTGNSAINTGMKADVDDMEFEIKVKPSDGSWYILQSRNSNGYIHGISGANSGSRMNGIWVDENGQKAIISDITRNTTKIYLVRYKAKSGNAELYVKNLSDEVEDTKTTTYGTFVAGENNMCIFGNLRGNVVKSGNNLYYAKIKKGGILVFDGIPVKMGNKVGIYNKVNGEFFEYDGSVGPELDTYTALEYATFNGTQIVDTGIYMNNDSKIESKFNGTASAMRVYGANSTNPRVTCYLMNTGNQRWGNVTVDSTGISPNRDNLLIQSKDGFNLNGVNKPYTGTAAFTTASTLTIGNCNGSTGTSYFSGKFYYIKIWDNDNLILDCTPAKRDSDGVVGFYDSVNNKFITPSTGVLS